MTCPYCDRVERQYKAGTNASGSQRYLCDCCQRKYTPQPKPQGYAASIRQQALRLYVDGMNLRRIARGVGMTHQSVSNWVAAYARQLPDSPPASTAPHEVHELDEVCPFVQTKKTAPTSSLKLTEPPAVS